MRSELSLEYKFTDVDYLLNSGRLKRAVEILSGVQKRLRQVYKEAQGSPG
jgi:hypothetical protein